MILAAGLWWVYFDSAAEVNLKVLELSGGSPTMARAVFAVGHMLPAFALLGLGPHSYLWLLAMWVAVCAVLTTSARDQLAKRAA